jgi:hypothetical protein
MKLLLFTQEERNFRVSDIISPSLEYDIFVAFYGAGCIFWTENKLTALVGVKAIQGATRGLRELT